MRVSMDQNEILQLFVDFGADIYARDESGTSERRLLRHRAKGSDFERERSEKMKEILDRAMRRKPPSPGWSE